MLTIQDFHRRFRTSDQCLHYLFELRFPEAVCPKCGRRNAYHRHRRKLCFTCNCGRHHIYPKMGTLFEHSPIRLSVWFYAIWRYWNSHGRITVKELHCRLDVAYPTASRIVRRICAAAVDEDREPIIDSLFLDFLERVVTGREPRGVNFPDKWLLRDLRNHR